MAATLASAFHEVWTGCKSPLLMEHARHVRVFVNKVILFSWPLFVRLEQID